MAFLMYKLTTSHRLDAQSEALRFDKIAMQQDEVPRRLAKLKSPFLRGVVGTGGIDASAPDVYAVNAVVRSYVTSVPLPN